MSGAGNHRPWQPVSTTVDAKIGPVLVRLAPFERDTSCGEDGPYHRPWAWLALCRVTFRFGGELVTTKRLTARYAYLDKLGWPREQKPTALAEGREWVIHRIASQLERHGLSAAGIEVVESDW